MPKMLADQNRKLTWVTTIADISAPKAATELTSGKDLQCLVTAADFQFGATGEDTTSDPALCSDTNTSLPARRTYEIGMNFFRYDSSSEDVPWTTFTEAGIHGYLVMRLGSDHSAAYAASDDVIVVEVVTGNPLIQNPEGGTGYEKFRVNFYAQNVDERAVVAT